VGDGEGGTAVGEDVVVGIGVADGADVWVDLNVGDPSGVADGVTVRQAFRRGAAMRVPPTIDI